MGLLDKNGDLVIDSQRIRSYNNLHDWETRPKDKDGFLRFDKRMQYWYFDADDGSQEHLICGKDHFARKYGFEKIEEIGEARRRKAREQQGYLKCYVCNIMQPSAVYLILQKTHSLFWDSGVRY